LSTTPSTSVRVVFPASRLPEAKQRFERAAALGHSLWWQQGRRGVAVAEDRFTVA
jgi:hypothetical protein